MVYESRHSEDLLTNALNQLQVSLLSGADLAVYLVDGPTEQKPQDLTLDEKYRFFEHLTCVSNAELNRVIVHMGGLNAFLSLLLQEAESRQIMMAEREYWFRIVRVQPQHAFNNYIPSSSTVSKSNKILVRFPRNCPAVCPAILRCKSFQIFHDINKSEVKIATSCLMDWSKFLLTSNRLHTNEKARCDAMFTFMAPWFEEIPGVEAWNGQDTSFADTESKIDIAFYIPALGNWPVVIIEYKNEAHSKTNADPIAQATHYYLQQLDTYSLRGMFNAPAVILQIVGTHAKAHAAIHSGHDLNGPAFVSIHTLAEVDMGVPHNMNDLLQRRVHAFWLAVKACVSSLVEEITSQLIVDLARPPRIDWLENKEWRPAHAFPWIVQVEQFEFEYIRVLGPNKMIFLVRDVSVRGEGEKAKEDKFMVVKFVDHTHYARETHELLAQQNAAPKLLHMHTINDEWTMLIMEWLGDLRNVDEFKGTLTAAHRDREASIIKTLHDAGFVHGDLRNANVMVDAETERLFIIDFDWSGKVGDVRYPLLMNSDIDWPAGATPTALIAKDHDWEWHHRRYAAVGDNA